MSNQLGQAQTGTLSSIPKVCKVSGDDNMKMLWKNMGNNHNTPFMWGQTVTFSGTSYVLASGIVFHGNELATAANVTITPLSDPGAGVRYYVSKNTASNVITIRSTASVAHTFDVQVMLGATNPDLTSLSCRGNSGTTPSYP